MSRRALGLVCTVALLASPGCQLARELRPYTYPPDFRYIEQDQLESTMWKLASHVARLDALLEMAEEGDPAAQQEGLVAVLGAVERDARELDGMGRSSNHPLLDRHLDEFLRDVRAALRDVEREPPRLVRAGSVAGACAHCHGLR